MWIAPPSIRSAYAAASACSTKALPLDFDTWAAEAAACSTLSGKLTLLASWKRAWKREAWMRRLFGSAISPSSPQDDFADWWTSSLLDSRVKTCPSPVAARGLMESDPDFSSMSSMSRTIAVRGDLFWRTSQASLVPQLPLWTRPAPPTMPPSPMETAFRTWALKMVAYSNARPPESWENWPITAGMRSGSLSQRPTWVPRTAAQDGFASPGGWATPDCNTATYSNGARGPNIREQSSQWMTPNVPNGGRHVPESLVVSRGTTPEGEKRTVGLESQTKYWSSPRASDSSKGGPNQSGSKGDLMLPSQVCQWPTPKASELDRGVCASEAARRSPALQQVASSWPTPAARDYRSESAGGGFVSDRMNQTRGQTLSFMVAHSSHQAQPMPDGAESLPTAPSLPRHLNPLFGAWLMGWPSTWTIAEPHALSASATELWRHKLDAQLRSCLGDPV